MMRNLAGLLLAVAVSSCSTATAPTPSVCRTYASAGTNTTSSTSGAGWTVVYTSDYDLSSNRLTTNYTYTNNNGTRQTYTTITAYASVQDFVDEIGVNPPRRRFAGLASIGDVAYTISNTYDAQHRHVSEINTGDGPADVYTTTNTAWDASGRPTAGNMVYPGGVASSFTFSYNDAARSETKVETTGGTVVTATQTYTADGNPLLRTQTTNGSPAVSTRTSTIAATAQACS